jgi:hypothetical protein
MTFTAHTNYCNIRQGNEKNPRICNIKGKEKRERDVENYGSM